MSDNNKLTQYTALLKQICNNWPEHALSHATWQDMCRNIKNLYKHADEMEKPLPTSAAIGYFPFQPSLTEKNGVAVPCAFPWAGFKGINFVSKKEDCEDACRNVMAPLLLRILSQAEQDTLLIHQVDAARLGEYLGIVPIHPSAPRITTEPDLARLLRSLLSEMAFSQGATWRIAERGISGPTVQHPIHIIAIAHWEELCLHTAGKAELSPAQQEILKMLRSEVAARFGVYFFICSNSEVATGEIPTISVTDKTLRIPAVTPALSGLRRIPYSCVIAALPPTAEQAKALQAAHQQFINGVLEDTDGEGIWRGNSAKGLRAVMGSTAEGTKQFFELGIGRAANAFHALVGGATGSGKSVLLNEIICSLAERYSPEELRFVLLDYKEGTEFAPYRGLPHIFALSIGSNAEFGLEALKWLREETERRGRLFKNAGVSNIADYRRVTGEKMCRYVVVADEFQRLCTDEKFGEEARMVLNDLVRRTRSFGMNFILATQTLRDNSLEGEAKTQFACRICLSLAESETSYFLSSDNDAPAHFSQKGQALVNYALGMPSGNIMFRSGNPGAPNGLFRTTDDIVRLMQNLTILAREKNIVPGTKYVYDGEDFVDLKSVAKTDEQEMLLGLRVNLESSPYSLNRRLIGGGVLIVGQDEKKNACVLNSIARQVSAMYGTTAIVQTPAEYLDCTETHTVTILNAAEGDFDLEEAMSAWKEEQEAAETRQNEQPAPATASVPMGFAAPVGMEGDFAELMQGLQNNMAAMSVSGNPAPSGRAGRQRRRNREEHPIVLSVKSRADLNLLREAHMSASDFRVVIYLDMVTYNQVSGNYERGELGASQVMIECPKGNVQKIRLGEWK